MHNWYSQDSFTSLGDGEVHIWLNYLNLHQAKLKHLYPLLSATEKERSERFKFFKHRKSFIAAHGFLHTVLAYYIPKPENGIQFQTLEYGKPEILTEQNPENIQFNLSHSNNLAILAVCRQHDIGIDIEFIQKKTDWLGITRRFYTETEQQAILNLPEEQQKDAFFQVWTRKEAHMKVTGQGMHLAPSQFEVTVPPAAAELVGMADNTKHEDFKMQDILLPDMYQDYFACLSCSQDFSDTTQFIHM